MRSKRRVVEEYVEQTFEPHVILKRTGWFSWDIRVKASEYGSDYFRARGSREHAEAKAARKLRAAVRKHEWANTVKRLDLQR